jgi:hypothetical protein
MTFGKQKSICSTFPSMYRLPMRVPLGLRDHTQTVVRIFKEILEIVCYFLT